MTSAKDLLDLHRFIVNDLSAPDGPADDKSLLKLAKRAAEALGDVVDDDDLWTPLSPQDFRPRAYVSITLAVNWEDVLEQVGYRPPPSAEAIHGEFVETAQAVAATNDPRFWKALQEQAIQLVQRLRDCIDPPQRDHSWQGRLRDRVGTSATFFRLLAYRSIADSNTDLAQTAVEFGIGALALPHLAPVIASKLALSLGRGVQKLRDEAEVREDQARSAIVQGVLWDKQDDLNWLADPTEHGRVASQLELVNRRVCSLVKSAEEIYWNDSKTESLDPIFPLISLLSRKVDDAAFALGGRLRRPYGAPW